MDSNALDDLLNTIQKTWHNINLQITPLITFSIIFALLIPLIPLCVFALTQREDTPLPPLGCRKLSIRGSSNLTDQFSKSYSTGSTEPTASSPWRVKALFIYPIKSCAPIELSATEISPKGLRYDRQFAFAQQVTGLPSLEGKVHSQWIFITQRTFPRMAKVKVEMWVPDTSAPEYDPQGEWVRSEGCLVVRFPFTPDTEFNIAGMRNYAQILAAKLGGDSEPMVEFRIPFKAPNERSRGKGYRKEKLKIWNDEIAALNVGCEVPDEVMAKLKYTLGVTNPLTLFRVDGEKFREVHGNTPTKEDVGFQTVIGMQDSYPVHMMNLAAVHDVSSRLPRSYSPLTALRYRPNILFTGPRAFTEDDWTRIRVKDLGLYIACRTTRCKLPNVDPLTGTADRNEPGTTMRKYRIVDKESKSACLGIQAVPLDDGVLHVGDEIAVLETDQRD